MPDNLNIALQNQTTSRTVYAYITGRAINNNNALFLLQSDGRTYYYPTSPPAIGSALARDCAIPLGNPGNTITVMIPQIAGGRIWFSVDKPLTFLLNPGPALVEPSVTNGTDPNIDTNWGFCEFTLNSSQLFANISYVDFVSLPISLTLTRASGATQYVSGMPPDGLDKICSRLQSQSAADGREWNTLIVTKDGRNLRALSPNNGIVTNPSLFSRYYDDYVAQVWSKYRTNTLSVNTQAAFGTVSGKIVAAGGDVLSFAGINFTRPSTADIFSCSTGPFATGENAQRNALIPRLAAAFNRSTVLSTPNLPADRGGYYRNGITNHYSRIVHEANLDGLGYAFPYDDVAPTGGPDQSGAVQDPNPRLLAVAVGGGAARVQSSSAREEL